MATKPTHVSTAPVVATVQIVGYWGNLQRDSITCGHHDYRRHLEDMVARFQKSEPTPPRCSFLVHERSYNRKKDAYTPWKPIARYNHLGLEIAL